MNQSLREDYDFRATVLSNIGNLIAHYSKKDTAQMSLFPISEDTSFEMTRPENINYKEIAAAEKDVLGVCLSYNEFDRFVLERLRFCNTTIEGINELIEDSDNLIFIATVDDIEYKKSQFGNNYAKLTLRDNITSINLFLFGDMYKKYIASIYKNKFYLIRASYTAETQRTNILSIKGIEDIDISDYVSGIKIYLGQDMAKLFYVKQYAGTKMFGNKFDLIFIYNGEEFKHPCKINFTEENYLDIKDSINSIEIIKNNNKN